MLRRPKILVMDEATASMDQDTDDMVKVLIKTEFQHTTIMTIAHRLDTVQDYDRIMVFDAGQLVEFDAPQVLLQNPDSFFARMAQAERQH